ncbi:MAG: hypothetical protein GXO78_04325 [Calditrichaeota bacterium]|nr:hypothetical protein [Calditrichota bacterium]
MMRCLFHRCWKTIGILLFSGWVWMAPTGAAGQDRNLEETLQELSEDAARQYVAPLSSAFGTNLNGGWFHRAPEAKMKGFHLEFGLVAMGTFFTDENRSFSTSGQFIFSVDEARQLVAGVDPAVQDELINRLTSEPSTVTISGPTVIGSATDRITILFPGKTFKTSVGPVSLPSSQIELPVGGVQGLSDLSALPMGAFQLTVGTLVGSQLTLRFLPSITLEQDLGTFRYFGFGVQHNPLVWLDEDLLPFDLAASFYTQKMEIGKLFVARATSFGINASKRIGWGMLNITPYVGYMRESATMDVTYQYVIERPTGPVSQDISFRLEGENRDRITYGISVRVLLVNINADYNIGKYNSVTIGINIII